eukprot:CAMPEP_0169382652 /NCGR_PEP_ID=MMETSP1017-20121227/42171_1 /TAXON_ID=342587 /ORGANISM="Karlodinium micrum, Strain CCMP2283" /LENGTH=62 /DNA_ID=CAMNT_0009482483 /DNA_START=253 /DNA_END=437 /DNA_ORIENTATION=+
MLLPKSTAPAYAETPLDSESVAEAGSVMRRITEHANMPRDITMATVLTAVEIANENTEKRRT